MIEKVNWYKDWFNSPFYHVLYQNRDDRDARKLIDNLITELNPNLDDEFLDLACGKGRHAIYLNSKGYKVCGVDMSENSIKEARKYENDSLEFFIGDMRLPLFPGRFNYILNLFTSFGYFENPADNLKTLVAVKKMLKPEGIFVLDFFNAVSVVKNLIPQESITIDGIRFDIKRNYDGKLVSKEINFTHNGHHYYFTERVEAFMKTDFEDLFNLAGFEIIDFRGDYNLNPYEFEKSDRLIILAKNS